jgi:hypothetical protein
LGWLTDFFLTFTASIALIGKLNRNCRHLNEAIHLKRKTKIIACQKTQRFFREMRTPPERQRTDRHHG